MKTLSATRNHSEPTAMACAIVGFSPRAAQLRLTLGQARNQNAKKTDKLLPKVACVSKAGDDSISAWYQYHNWSICFRYNKKGIADRAEYDLDGYQEVTDRDLHWILESNGVAPELAETVSLKNLQLVGDDGEVLQDSNYHLFRSSLLPFILVKVDWCTETSDDFDAPIKKNHGHGSDVVGGIEVSFSRWAGGDQMGQRLVDLQPNIRP